MVTESSARGHVGSAGASPTVWAIFFTSLAVSIALVLEGSVRVAPDWARWWAAILGLEISAYTLTLFLPPFVRVNLLHAICRVGVGMLMRLFVVALCTLLLVVGGEANLVGGLKLFWAAQWPSAIGQIICVAIAVYCFRVIAMRRSAAPQEATGVAAPAPVSTRSADELLEELMSDGASFESAETSSTAEARPPAAAQPEAFPRPAHDSKAGGPETAIGASPAHGPLRPSTTGAQRPPRQYAADAVNQLRSAHGSRVPDAATEAREWDGERADLAGAAAEATGDEDQSEPARVSTQPLPTTPVREWPTPPPVTPPPPQAPPKPLAAVVSPEPIRLPTAPGLAPTKADREDASPKREMPVISAAERSVSGKPPASVPPTFDRHEMSATPAIAPDDADEVAPPPPAAEVEEEGPREPRPAYEELASAEDDARPAAEPAPASVPLADPSTSGALSLPAEVVLHALPPDLLDRPVEEVAEKVPEGVFSFEWEIIAPQLERGQVRVSGQALLGQMPRDMLTTSAGDFLSCLPTEGIELPLAEIVTRLPAEFFVAPPDQIAAEPIGDEPPIFEEGSGGLAGEPPRPRPEVAQPPPPAPPAAPKAEPVVAGAPPSDIVAAPTPGAAEGPEPSETDSAAAQAPTTFAPSPPGTEPEPPAVPEAEPVAAGAPPADTVSATPEVAEEPEPSETDSAGAQAPTTIAPSPPEPEPEPPAVPKAEPVVASTPLADMVSATPEVAEEPGPSEADAAAAQVPTTPAPSPPEPHPTPAGAFQADAFDMREHVIPEAEPALAQGPPPRNEEHVISSAIAALQRRREAEGKEAGEEAPGVTKAAPAADSADMGSEAEPPTPTEAAVSDEPPLAEAAVGDQPMPTTGEAEILDEPQPESAAAVAAEPSDAQVEEAATASHTPAVPAPEPACEPAAPSPVDPHLEAELRNALRVLGCKGIEMIRANGVSVVVAHTSPHATSELASSLAELVKATRHVAAETGAGGLHSALLIGAHATTFVGSPENPRAPHLVVATDNASAGQTTVAARKAISLLESVETAQETGADEPARLPPARLPDEDHALMRLAAGIRQQVGAFRSEEGFGVVAFGLQREPSAGTAAAAEAVWRAAQAVQPSGIDRLLVMGSSRALGLAMAAEADALIVAGFAAGMNPGLVATEAAKLARMCNDFAQREGMPRDGG